MSTDEAPHRTVSLEALRGTLTLAELRSFVETAERLGLAPESVVKGRVTISGGLKSVKAGG